MSDWSVAKFHTLAADHKSSFSVGPFGSSVTTADYVEEGFPFIRGVNLALGRFFDDGFVFISPTKADEVKSAIASSGDLIFTRKGTIGQVSMIPKRSRYGKYVISGSQMKASLDPSVAFPDFYYYWFRSAVGRQALLANASTVGVPSIANSLQTLKNIEVPIPPLSVQRAIAGVLGSLDDKIAVNERIADTYEKLLASRFDVLAVDVEEIEAPISVVDLVHFNPPLPKPKRDEAVYLDMASVSTTRARVQEWMERVPKSGVRFQNGDTVMARITPCLENGKTAFVDFMEPQEVGIGSTEFIVMRPRPGVPVHLPYFLARSPRFRAHAVRNMVGSSGRQRVGAGALAQFTINQPDVDQMVAFGREAEAAFAHMKSLDAESRNLREIRDTLLPGLMSGAMRVRDAEKVVEGAV